MFRLTRSQVQPIGLDIGHDSVKMLQVETVGDSLSVKAAARQSLPDDAKGAPTDVRMAIAVNLIRQMLRQNPFAGKRVVTSLPRGVLHYKNLRLPQIPANELAAAVQFEARNIFPFDVDLSQIHYLPAGEVRQGSDVRQEVIVMAARNEDVDNFLEQLNRAGVVVESLDVEPCALFRSVERFIRRREDEHDVQVLVDIGCTRSQVVIGKGREISFFKAIDIGAQHLHDAVSRKLGITLEEARALHRRIVDAGEPADVNAKRDPVRQAVFDATRSVMEDLGREISLCLRYYSVTFRGHRPSRLRLAGGEAADVQLQQLLQTALAIPVEAGRPLYSVNTSRMKPDQRQGALSEWTLAFGLGLKLTKDYFGSRDGRPRDPNGSPLAAGAAEVVDVAKVAEGDSRKSEVIHA